MENHEQKISGGREGFWLNRPNKILTEGTLGWSAIKGMGDDLSGFLAKTGLSRPQTEWGPRLRSSQGEGLEETN